MIAAYNWGVCLAHGVEFNSGGHLALALAHSLYAIASLGAIIYLYSNATKKREEDRSPSL